MKGWHEKAAERRDAIFADLREEADQMDQQITDPRVTATLLLAQAVMAAAELLSENLTDLGMAVQGVG